jgi:hypothetical protein
MDAMDLTNLNGIIEFFNRLIFYHPYISMGIAATLGILVYIKPKEVVKLLLIFLGFCIVAYVLYYIWGAFQSGYLHKEEIINKSL